jgi:hypothetical protein
VDVYVVRLITRAENSCVNEEALTCWGLSHQIKFIVGQSGGSPAEIEGSNSTVAWMSVVGVVSRPEESLCANEEVLTHRRHIK